MAINLDAARAELRTIVQESHGPRASIEELTIRGDGLMVIPANAYPCDEAGLQDMARRTEAIIKKPDFPPFLKSLSLVIYARSPRTKGAPMVEDNSVWASQAAVSCAANASAVALLHTSMSMPVAYPAGVRQLPIKRPVWIRPHGEGHYVVAVVLSDKAALAVLPLPQTATAMGTLQTRWLNGKTPRWGKESAQPIRQMVGNADFGTLWSEEAGEKLMTLSLKRGDMILADPSTVFYSLAPDALLLTYYLAEGTSPKTAVELLDQLRAEPVFDPEKRFPNGEMVTYGFLLKDGTPTVVDPQRLQFPLIPLNGEDGSSSVSHFFIECQWKFLGKFPTITSLNDQAKRIFEMGRFLNETLNVKIKGVHLTGASASLQQTRSTLSNRLTALGKKDIWTIGTKELQEINDGVVACAADIAAWQAEARKEKTLPPAERLLKVVRAGLDDMAEELAQRNDPAIQRHVEWLNTALASETARISSEVEEIRRTYLALAQAFNPYYKGEDLPTLPAAATETVAPAVTPMNAKAPKKSRKAAAKNEEDIGQDPKNLGFHLVKTRPPATSDSVVHCPACDGDGIPIMGRFCGDCCAEAATALATHVAGAGLLLMENRQDPALKTMIAAVHAFRQDETTFRSLHEDVAGVATVDDERRSLNDLLSAFVTLQDKFKNHRVNLEQAADKFGPDEVDAAYSSSDDNDDEDDDDDEDEDEDEEEDEEEDDDEVGESEPEDADNCTGSSSSASSEKRPLKKSKRRNGAAADEEADLDGLVVESEEAEREEQEARKLRAKKRQEAKVAVASVASVASVAPSGTRALAAERLLNLERTLPTSQAAQIADMKRRWHAAKEDVELAGLIAEMKRVEESWSTFYVLDIGEPESSAAKNKSGKRARAIVTSVGPWNNVNDAQLAALDYKQLNPELDVKVVEKKRGDQ